MKKGRIILAGLTLFVAIGGAFAFKASRTVANVYTYDPVASTFNKIQCQTAGTGTCSLSPNQQLYTYSATQGFVTIARSAAHPAPNL